MTQTATAGTGTPAPPPAPPPPTTTTTPTNGSASGTTATAAPPKTEGGDTTTEAGGILGSSEDSTTDKGDQSDTTEGDKGKPDTAAPAEIEIKLPDGVPPDVVLLDKFKPIAKELGLKSEGAQKLVDFYLGAMGNLTEKAQQEAKRQNDEWGKQLAEDKDFGGQQLNANVLLAKKAVEKFGGTELRKTISDFGIGNHPVFVKAFARIGKAISEDSIAGTSGGSSTPNKNDPEAGYRKLYPSMYETPKE